MVGKAKLSSTSHNTITMSNGCGCQSGVLRFFKPPFAKYFYLPCCIHDDAYDWGGNYSARLRADRSLFYNMAKLILKNESNPFKIVFLSSVALAYYIAVRIFGRFYFNYGQQ